MAKIGAKFKALLANKPTRKPTKPKTYSQTVQREVGKQMYSKHPTSTVGKRYHEAVERAGRLKRRRVARKLVYGAPEAIKESWNRPSAVRERKSIARSFKKGGRKVLRKLL